MAMSNEAKKAALTKVEGAILDRRGEFAKLLPRGWTLDRFVAQARVAVAKTPKLLEVQPASVVMALYQCAELGLVPGGGLGHGWIVPYGKSAQWVTGYKGLVYLATKAKVVKAVRTVCVYQHEKDAGVFRHKEGGTPLLEHEVLPPPEGKEPVLIAAYCRMLLDDGQHDFHVMYRHKLLEHRERSSGYKNAIQYSKPHPWITDFDAMCMKTTIRMALKNAPASSEAEWGERLERAFATEDAEFELPEDEDETPPPATSGMDNLRRTLAAKGDGQTLEQHLETPRQAVHARTQQPDDYTPPEPPPDVALPR